MIVSLLFAAVLMFLGREILRRWCRDFDPAAKIGVYGLAGLGAMGLLEQAAGLIRIGTTSYILPLAFVILVLFRIKPKLPSISTPKGFEWAFVSAYAIAILFALIGAAAPSTAVDWDSLAYHLAVPKLWIEQGHISSIPFIHHSNFPQVVDSLYILGLQWGGQAGAKAFSVAFLVFGVFATFGLARQEYGKWAAWWAGLGLTSVPLIVWESGTAYIDVAHGLYAGLGIYFAAKLLSQPEERRWLWLSAIFLGLAAGSKYTGLQTIFAACLMLGVGLMLKKQAVQAAKHALLLGVLALAIASPWYVRNVIWTRNPVYPFFYSKLGGKWWSAKHAIPYTHEQNSFGVGREPATTEHPDIANNPIAPARIGHAILGLAYQPGRYINPGQTEGFGMPIGAFGAVLLAGMLVWMISGKARALEIGVIGASLITLGMWFVLSEQSRYVVALAPPLAILLGGAVSRLKVGSLLAGLAAAQAAYCLWLLETTVVAMELPVVTGNVTPEQYQQRYIPFYAGSQQINKLGPNSKTALYDEVFGFLLDVPYVWANPGHSTLIPYDSMQNGEQYIAAMKKLGFTHVYLNLQTMLPKPEDRAKWSAAAGLNPPTDPSLTIGYTMADRRGLFENFEQKYKVLLADAIREKRLSPAAGTERWLLFKID